MTKPTSNADRTTNNYETELFDKTNEPLVLKSSEQTLLQTKADQINEKRRDKYKLLANTLGMIAFFLGITFPFPRIPLSENSSFELVMALVVAVMFITAIVLWVIAYLQKKPE